MGRTESSAEATPVESAPMRSDLMRNRHRILIAARALLATADSADVQLEDIARAAGVGRATLFRHIRSKDALITEIYQERLADIGALTDRALDHPDPWQGFELMIRTWAAWLHEDRGLYDYTRRLVRQDFSPENSREVFDKIDRVIRRAQDAGCLWPELRRTDLIPLLAFTAEPGSDRVDGFAGVILRGLRVPGSGQQP